MSSNLPSGAIPSTSSFTCNTCGIKFPTPELQRQHMKTDWHRYNLKRRVAQLPTITSTQFAELVLARQKHDEQEEGGMFEDEYGFVVHKRVGGSGGRQITKKDLRRLMRERISRSRETKDSTATIESQSARSPSVASVESSFSEFSLEDEYEKISISEVDSTFESSSEYNFTDKTDSELGDEDSESDGTDHSDTEDEHNGNIGVDITTCFYCNMKNNEVEPNIRHMFSKHGLYIPERSYLVDLEGLLTFLGEVIIEDHECLVCGFLGKNLQSIRQHIISKGHCRIPYETKGEKEVISEFYDFTTPQKENTGTKKVSFQTAVGDKEEKEDEDDVDDLDDKENDEENDKEFNGINDNYSVVHIDPSGVELTLPTGSRIGHRSMTRYYRQNPAVPRELNFNDSQKTVSVVDRRFAPGLTYSEVNKQEKIMRRSEYKAKNRELRRLNGGKSKINHLAHFRDELLQ